MNVIIQIEGREAIPVRAIPFVTDWSFMSPDVIVRVLGGIGGNDGSVFGDLESYRVESGQVKPIKKNWWVQFPLEQLQALTEKIKAGEPIEKVGYSVWRKQSIRVLPAGAFVWKDDYQKLHDKNWNERFQVDDCALKNWNGEESDEEVESPRPRKWIPEEVNEDSHLRREFRERLEVLKRWREPDYCPFMEQELCDTVMEGFEAQTKTPAPVVEVGVSVGVESDKAGPIDKAPWLAVDPKDPVAKYHWYTSARYFARQLVRSDSTLLNKKLVLADRVSQSLYSVCIYKRGGKKRLDASTVLKAFSNMTWG